MSDQDFKTNMFNELTEIRKLIQTGFAQGEKRMDQQDIAISDITDQIKGNPAKEIIGIRAKLRELQSILIIPIMVNKLPLWAKWVFGWIVVDAVADINSMGVIAFAKFLLHNIKP